MNFMLYFSVGYLLVTTFILFRNRKDFTPLLPAAGHPFGADAPVVSICIPARNEEQVIERCVRSVLTQTYPNFELLVLDDESTDQTRDILENCKKHDQGKLELIDGKPKPDNWLGKNWACHQLAEKSRGDILLFMDADTWLEKDAIPKTVRSMGHDIVDFLTVWPRQELGSFWEKTVIPLVYYALLSLLPARYVYKIPRWIPLLLRKKTAPFFAAACGQFMAFKKKAYERIGGHRSVKTCVVEDVELAKRIKKSGYSMKMYHGSQSVSCRMYTSYGELQQGFRKNFFAGFNYHTLFFLAMASLHAIVFLLPFLILPYAIYSGYVTWIWLSAGAVSLILLHRTLLAAWFGWNPVYGLLHPVGVLWFQKLGIQVLMDYYKGTKARWKGRAL